jgi:hypothetical protein
MRCPAGVVSAPHVASTHTCKLSGGFLVGPMRAQSRAGCVLRLCAVAAYMVSAVQDTGVQSCAAAAC